MSKTIAIRPVAAPAAGALAAMRALGMQTALHTAGMYPQRLAAPPLLPPGRSRQSKSASLARALSALPCGAPEKKECARKSAPARVRLRLPSFSESAAS